jgi:hypothetical protein
MKLVDLTCNNCNHVWEVLLTSDEAEWLGKIEVVCKCDGETFSLQGCPECGSKDVAQVLGGYMTKCHDPSVREQVLRKRSIDHSNLHAKENLEKLQNKGVLKLK